MNFLQLCQAVAEDSGTVAGGSAAIESVLDASARTRLIVGWVRNGYIDIQNERPDWRWMRRDFEGTLTIDQIEYEATDLDAALTDVGVWLPDVPADDFRNITLYESGEQEQEGELFQIPYPLFRRRYLRGVHDHNKPTEWAISPRNELLFGNKPDKAYIVRGEYMMAPEELEEDEDEPSMPARFHRVIVQEALRLMMRSDEAYNALAEKTQQYDRLRNALVREQTPDISFGGGSLA